MNFIPLIILGAIWLAVMFVLIRKEVKERKKEQMEREEERWEE